MTTIDSQGNITHVKGDTFALSYTAVKLDAVTIAWAGYTMKFTVKQNSTATTSVFELTQASGIDLTVDGQITITRSAALMKLLPARSYVYDLEVTSPAGVVCTWFNNKKFVIKQDVAS